jgi:hypothetical protein
MEEKEARPSFGLKAGFQDVKRETVDVGHVVIPAALMIGGQRFASAAALAKHSGIKRKAERRAQDRLGHIKRQLAYRWLDIREDDPPGRKYDAGDRGNAHQFRG